jgi:hypothetical protein
VDELELGAEEQRRRKLAGSGQRRSNRGENGTDYF